MNTTNSRGSRSLLAELRALSPPRPLTVAEARLVTEAQAELLLKRLPHHGRPLLADLTTAFPSIRIVYDCQLPVAGSAHWNGTQWIVVLNGSNDRSCRPLALLHLLKRIIDHGRPGLLPTPHGPRTGLAEAVADHFALCVALPEAQLLDAWRGGRRQPAVLAAHFDVTPGVIRRRLTDLVTDGRAIATLAEARPAIDSSEGASE